MTSLSAAVVCRSEESFLSVCAKSVSFFPCPADHKRDWRPSTAVAANGARKALKV